MFANQVNPLSSEAGGQLPGSQQGQVHPDDEQGLPVSARGLPPPSTDRLGLPLSSARGLLPHPEAIQTNAESPTHLRQTAQQVIPPPPAVEARSLLVKLHKLHLLVLMTSLIMLCILSLRLPFYVLLVFILGVHVIDSLISTWRDFRAGTLKKMDLYESFTLFLGLVMVSCSS
jgi:hypothetical protein